MRPAGPVPEIPLPVQGRRIRIQRIVCLSLIPFLAIPLFLAATGPFAPVDHDAPVAVQSVEGQSSYAPSTEADETSSSVKPSTTTTTTLAPTTSTVVTTTIAPVVRTAKKATPTTEAAPVTTEDPAPTTAAAPVATTAPRPVVTAPRPVVTAPRPVIAAAPAPTTTTTTAPPAPRPPHSQSGQATWYRWRAGNCAHNSLPKGTKVTVTAVATGRSTTCVVGDRGGFRNPTIIDLDASVFAKIAPLGSGRIAVTISW